MMEWIKVTDRKPNDEQLILAYGRFDTSHYICERSSVYPCHFHVWGQGSFERNDMFETWDTLHQDGELKEVTHWMPLPSIPDKKTVHIFRNLESPGGTTVFYYRQQPDGPVIRYEFVDGLSYEVSKDLVELVNKSCKYYVEGESVAIIRSFLQQVKD